MGVEGLSRSEMAGYQLMGDENDSLAAKCGQKKKQAASDGVEY